MKPCGRETCHDCPESLLCHCMQVSEAEVVDVIVSLEARTTRDVQRHTGAGGGCTACCRRISLLIKEFANESCGRAVSLPVQSYSSEPICSVR